jgi:hypothetical protein
MRCNAVNDLGRNGEGAVDLTVATPVLPPQSMGWVIALFVIYGVVVAALAVLTVRMFLQHRGYTAIQN